MRDFQRTGFNDRASSVIVDRGLWEVCDGAGFRGKMSAPPGPTIYVNRNGEPRQ
ncbi:MAG: beta/gamma crystallin-related protein [Vicinamibacteria bacterium]